jgi:molecular chaperone DnaJ
MGKDYYSTLGIDKTATKEEIKKAYKKLAKQFHPDINKDSGATEKFKEINEAASVLGDDQKRAMFDQHGTAEPGQGYGPRDFDGFRNSGEDFDFGDIFDMFFGGSGGFSRGRRKDVSGSDLRFDLRISLDDVAKGLEKTIVIQRMSRCDDCRGSGAKDGSGVTACSVCRGSGQVVRSRRTAFGIFQTTAPCTACSGEGHVIKNQCEECSGKGRSEKEAKIKINIPAGVEEGMRLRYEGEGEAGIRGGESGDLYIVIHVNEHKIFRREHDDILIDIPISFTQAALGDTIEIPTIDGKAKLKIPQGTQTETTFRLKGYGIPHLNRNSKGDELAKVRVQVPENISKKQKELLEQFAKESGDASQPIKGFFKSFFEKI